MIAAMAKTARILLMMSFLLSVAPSSRIRFQETRGRGHGKDGSLRPSLLRAAASRHLASVLFGRGRDGLEAFVRPRHCCSGLEQVVVVLDLGGRQGGDGIHFL